jgi:Family of unknown function (DUF5677)
MGKFSTAVAFGFGVATGAAAVLFGCKRSRTVPRPKLSNNLEGNLEIFAGRHAASVAAVQALHATALDFLTLPMDRKGPGDNTIYLLAAACLHEFNEIILLATHMYGTGAVKLLRPLYERVVTLSYLAKNPGEVQQFIDYSDVHWNKLLEEAKRVFGAEAIPKIVSRNAADAIAANYQKNRVRFLQTDCKKCGTTRLQGSWTKKGTPELAGDVNDELRSLYFKAFLSPTLHIHTTFWGIVDQLKPSGEGKVGFNQEHEEESARDAMDIAHALMVQVLDVVNAHFKLDKDSVVRQRAGEWAQAWRETAPPGYPPKD